MNTHTAHTPGPWTAKRSSDGIVVANQSAFATGAASIVIVPRIRAEWEANARLIAAAPTLFCSLQSCVEMLEEMLRTAASNDQADAIDMVLTDARAAIAKATGKAQP